LVVMAIPSPRTVAFEVRGPLSRGDLPGLYSRICRLLTDASPAVALCDVHDVAADAVTVDALARLQLAARRHGCQIRLCRASPELRELLALVGLQDVVPE
jgi:ABC-type transporter Mla MlaB component